MKEKEISRQEFDDLKKRRPYRKITINLFYNVAILRLNVKEG